MSDISSMRHPYHGQKDHFDVNNLHSRNPFKQFEKWFQEARDVEQILEPNAMTVATASKSGVPSVRIVLMKAFSEERGFTFYTNYGSRKAKELDENPNCSLMFYWEPLRRSVRIEGKVTKASKSDSEKYFHSRPRDSQISACVSNQSQVIPSRAYLDEQHAKIQKEVGDDKPIQMPDYWGGYDIKPSLFEFWQGQTNRLHDRIVFRRPLAEEKINPDTATVGENGWVIERLSS
ncbi:hypothetical protein SNE40_011522 [Patella caerulea]|uniref:pyridoxal 5'-phosphate synthase n=1 Tax=Patella caerulea TaxID=87958 RepID=A0AAN8JJA4_PATCE